MYVRCCQQNLLSVHPRACGCQQLPNRQSYWSPGSMRPPPVCKSEDGATQCPIAVNAGQQMLCHSTPLREGAAHRLRSAAKPWQASARAAGACLCALTLASSVHRVCARFASVHQDRRMSLHQHQRCGAPPANDNEARGASHTPAHQHRAHATLDNGMCIMALIEAILPRSSCTRLEWQPHQNSADAVDLLQAQQAASQQLLPHTGHLNPCPSTPLPRPTHTRKSPPAVPGVSLQNTLLLVYQHIPQVRPHGVPRTPPLSPCYLPTNGTPPQGSPSARNWGMTQRSNDGMLPSAVRAGRHMHTEYAAGAAAYHIHHQAATMSCSLRGCRWQRIPLVPAVCSVR